MPGVARKFSDTVGGGIALGSSNVFINNLMVAQRGDRVTPHPPCCCGPSCGCQEHCVASLLQSSSTVFANGINIVRQGDRATCMHPISGSFNVFSG
jgi:uncharacterized Zn-binding protein involved in type VI secretion